MICSLGRIVIIILLYISVKEHKILADIKLLTKIKQAIPGGIVPRRGLMSLSVTRASVMDLFEAAAFIVNRADSQFRFAV